jgi:hypothetical protein
MRTPLVASILVSLVLVGGAVGYRVSNIEEKKVALETIESKNIDWQDISAQVASNASSTTKSAAVLNKTDLIGRQLIFDYIELATGGNASDETIQALADKYAESIPTLSTPKKVTAFEIKTTTETKENFQAYADNITRIHTSFATKTRMAGAVPTELGQTLYSTSKKVGEAYLATAEELKKIPVPTSLVPLHLELVNKYYSSGSAMISLSKADSDPAIAFAGIIALRENTGAEQGILQAIELVLTRHGI